MPSVSERSKNYSSPVLAADGRYGIDPVLLRMREVVSRLERAIHSGQGTERLWTELRDCNRELSVEASRARLRQQ